MRPGMFKVQRRIFAEQLELRFKVDGTPDKHTLLALKLDPSVNMTQEDGIFSKRTAAQLLMVGEYCRRLVRRHKLMVGCWHGRISGFFCARPCKASGFINRGNRWRCQEGASERALTC